MQIIKELVETQQLKPAVGEDDDSNSRHPQEDRIEGLSAPTRHGSLIEQDNRQTVEHPQEQGERINLVLHDGCRPQPEG